MDRAQKRELVDNLNETWKGIGAVVVAHYTGMTVAEMTEYRKRMKAAGGAGVLEGDPDSGWRLERWSSEPLGGLHLADDRAHDVTGESADEAVHEE